MIVIKDRPAIERMRDSCRIAATVLARLKQLAAPGVATADLDEEGRKLIESYGARSACHRYRVGSRRFPSYTCISVNEEVVHGIGTPDRILQPGDVASLDVTVIYDGYVGDNAATVAIGPVSPEIQRLLQATEEALHIGVGHARVGNRIGDISHAIQTYVESRGFSVVRDMVGHGVGASMHEEPQIPNFGRPGVGPRIVSGMTLAIEPMVNLGLPGVKTMSDGWTIVAADGRPSAHFEHTVLTTENGPEILTVPEPV